jgi:predicted amidohydrolase
MSIRVSGVQMLVSVNVGQNLKNIRSALLQASQVGADILLTPEGALSGYTPDFNHAELKDALKDVTAYARHLKIGLALGTCFCESDGQIYNELRFYTPEGEYLGFHSKILRCGNLTDSSEGEINHYVTMPLQVFTFRGIQVGGLICNDMWANPGCTPMPDPHLSQQLAGMGARIIFHAVNGGRDGSTWSREVTFHYHETNLRMRARAGGVWIVTVDNCFPLEYPCSAPGGVIDPGGNWVCRTEMLGEQFFTFYISEN